MPEQAHAEERHAEWDLAYLQGTRFFETCSKSFWNDRDRVRRRNKVWNREEMRRCELKAAAKAMTG